MPKRRREDTKPTTPATPKKRGRKGKRMYFDNPLVEELVVRYQKGGCTDLNLRNEIMGHSHELIIQVMRTNNLQNIYPYRDQTAEADLFQAAWSEIERSLYKFDSKRGTKIFNLWTQVARSSMLALIKREGRDRKKKNQVAYKNHLRRANKQQLSFERFISEVAEVCKDNADHLKIVKALQEIYKDDERPTEGLVAKLIEKSGLSRVRVQKFIALVRDRAQDFSDAPIHHPPLRRSGSVTEFDPEDED
jgi:hypothetical protein